ncbi:MAG TPA: alkaline phosphatase family protein, partial [Verrucomicrobiae bacterium]|nr:alkaline phosphatase family protein [Verrucomicrobiae bacterium]
AAQHGIVGNGWYNRELAEVQFWRQSNHLVHGRKIWEELRELVPGFTCAKLFWWHNMYSTADYSVTPRPIYTADGRKFFDIYSRPYELRPKLKETLGEFPFATFWGPAAGVQTPQGGRDAATRWIAGAAKWIETNCSPSLNLVYLPHLDYNMQRLGPAHPAIGRDLQEIDTIVGDLIEFFAQRSVQVILLSEYGIGPVNTPVHINRALREEGWLTVKEELGRELLDCGASRAFAVADHQVAHVYLNDPSIRESVFAKVGSLPGVGAVLDRRDQVQLGIDHSRSGDLIAVANKNAWFTYYYWQNDSVAPDFARCVDIHRKPGYDPVELFLDPKIRAADLKILYRLLKKKMGFRMLMDVIPLDATLVKGSHGRRPERSADFPLLITQRAELLPNTEICSTDVYHLLKRHMLY